jgi:hypothetical protein
MSFGFFSGASISLTPSIMGLIHFSWQLRPSANPPASYTLEKYAWIWGQNGDFISICGWEAVLIIQIARVFHPSFRIGLLGLFCMRVSHLFRSFLTLTSQPLR